jgi:hypothetical protein
MAATNKLTATAVRSAQPREKTYKLSDGGGMYLEVTPNGGMYWRLKYRYHGKEKRLAIGVYGEGAGRVSLAQARKARDEAKELLAQGLDPSTAKRLAKEQGRDSRRKHLQGGGDRMARAHPQARGSAGPLRAQQAPARARHLPCTLGSPPRWRDRTAPELLDLSAQGGEARAPRDRLEDQDRVRPGVPLRHLHRQGPARSFRRSSW